MRWAKLLATIGCIAVTAPALGAAGSTCKAPPTGGGQPSETFVAKFTQEYPVVWFFEFSTNPPNPKETVELHGLVCKSDLSPWVGVKLAFFEWRRREDDTREALERIDLLNEGVIVVKRRDITVGGDGTITLSDLHPGRNYALTLEEPGGNAAVILDYTIEQPSH
jgi:hypothetical protein